ncbi:uromodulin [Nematostella vectensis]|uniref:uromodulin n=1 Tax=Nematostella vectensis TaxID=45351 RepID=UPI0020778953|nr:uromodulin [Nematostella vectensis]
MLVAKELNVSVCKLTKQPQLLIGDLCFQLPGAHYNKIKSQMHFSNICCSFLLVIVYISGILFCWAESQAGPKFIALQRNLTIGNLSYARFRFNAQKYLDIPKEVYSVVNASECALHCLRNFKGLSFNMKILADESGKFDCEVLTGDRFVDLSKYKNSSTHHHYSLYTECERITCKNSGTCIPSYETGDFTCACQPGYTGRFCEIMPSWCYSYTQLTEADRHMNFGNPNLKCDHAIITTKWYRFMGSAGTRMPTSCVPMNRCNTAAPGWLNGAHPSATQGVMTRQVCFTFNGNCCAWSVSVGIQNCGGLYYVYRLAPPPICDLRYCGV